MKIKKIWRRVCKLHEQGAYHVKRGFCLRDSLPFTASNHLIEEATELQAEVVERQINYLNQKWTEDDDADNYNRSIEEAADVLLVFLHLILVSNLRFKDILKFAWKKLNKNFTLNKDEVLTKTPGFNRSNRNNYTQEDLAYDMCSKSIPKCSG